MSDRTSNEKLLTTRDFVTAQTIDLYCGEVVLAGGEPGTLYSYDREGVLVKQSKIDGSGQKVLPASICSLVLYMAHYHVFGGHPGERRLYHTLRGEFYWPHMANEECTTVANCQTCAARRTKHVIKRYYSISSCWLTLICGDGHFWSDTQDD